MKSRVNLGDGRNSGNHGPMVSSIEPPLRWNDDDDDDDDDILTCARKLVVEQAY